MSITDELRHLANEAVAREEYMYELPSELISIAERIDVMMGDRIELPKDADGVPIRIGDVMESVINPSIHREVTGVGVECFYAWKDGCSRYSQIAADLYRHHHELTVEDVLREFVERWHDTHHDDIPALFAEYAAKFRLAGEEE